MLLVFEPDKCTGCRMCEMACCFHHYNTIGFENSNIHILFDEPTAQLEAVYCQHCEEAPCLSVCSIDAISKDKNTGLVKINHIKCIGCKACILACPLAALSFDEEKTIVVKCDWCDYDPVCVKYCSPGALKVNE